MQYFNDPDSKEDNEARIARLMPYQINEDLIKGLDCKIMHDMPIHDGFEITASMVRDPRSIIFPQSGNRLHAQKGLLYWLYEQNGKLP